MTFNIFNSVTPELTRTKTISILINLRQISLDIWSQSVVCIDFKLVLIYPTVWFILRCPLDTLRSQRDISHDSSDARPWRHTPWRHPRDVCKTLHGKCHRVFNLPASALVRGWPPTLPALVARGTASSGTSCSAVAVEGWSILCGASSSSSLCRSRGDRDRPRDRISL